MKFKPLQRVIYTGNKVGLHYMSDKLGWKGTIIEQTSKDNVDVFFDCLYLKICEVLPENIKPLEEQLFFGFVE